MHSDLNKNSRGSFIVIDGTDGSGKTTQFQLLVKRLQQAGHDVVTADFPQYGKKSAGLVEEYLNGKYGSALEVGPYRASIFYAIDRYDASFQIRQWLDQGKVVVSNRYVTANMAHQGGKITDPNQRQAYLRWVENLEFKLFGIPRPDLTIILHVDAAIAQALVDNKAPRNYVNGQKRDLHEADLDHLRAAEKVYLEIADKSPDCALISCTDNGAILPRETIGELVWERVSPLLRAKLPQPSDLSSLLERAYPQADTEAVTVSRINPSIISSASPRHDSLEQNNLNLKVMAMMPDARLPARAHAADAGLDLYAAAHYTLFANDITAVGTGISLAIPAGYAGLIWDKSGLAARGLKTAGGVIDAGYRGEIKVVMINFSGDVVHIAKGQKIAQLLVQKIEAPDITATDALDDTSRGTGGFGSTGRF